MLLLHGAGTTSHLWTDVMCDLAAATWTIAPDLAYLGRSEVPRRRTDLGGQAALFVDLLDALDVPRVVVAGHGLGGTVAVHLAAQAPDRVAGMALLAAPIHTQLWPPPAVAALLVPGLGAALTQLAGAFPDLTRAALRALLGAGDVPSSQLDAYASVLRTADGRRGLLAFLDVVDLAGAEAAWQLVGVAPPPTLLLWGERDTVFSVGYGRRLAGERPTAAWVPVADAGHLLPVQRPERVAEELAAFVAELSEA